MTLELGPDYNREGQSTLRSTRWTFCFTDDREDLALTGHVLIGPEESTCDRDEHFARALARLAGFELPALRVMRI